MKFKCGAFQGDPSTVGLWHLDGNSKDSSGHGNNGTDTNVTYGTQYGKFGQGASFNGSTSYINASSSAGISINSPFSMNLWMNVQSQPANNTPAFVSSWVNSTGGSGLEGAFQFQLYNNGGTMQTYISRRRTTLDQYGVNYTFPTNTWHMATFTWDGATLKLFVDGSSTPIISGASTAAAAGTLTGSNGVTLGQDPTNPNRFFNGYIDDVSIFSRALSTSEIAQMYTAGMTKHTTGRNFAGKILALLATTINFSETVSNSDTFLKGLYRTFSEAVTNSDIFQSLKILSYQFVEAVQSTDTLLRTIGKNFSEAITNSDSLLKSISKGFSEAVTNSDTFSQIRLLTINFIEMIQNTDWLFLNGQLVDRWLRRVHGTISWTKRTIGSIAWINRNKPKP